MSTAFDSKGNAVSVNDFGIPGGLVGDFLLKPKPKDPIEKLILFFTKLTATIQIGVQTLLWGVSKDAPPRTVVKNPKTGFLEVIKGIEKNAFLKTKNFLQSGLFNILDIINSLDLCGIIAYQANPTNAKKAPRPPKNTWTTDQIALYYVQDRAKEVQDTIDKFLALPNSLVSDYIGVQPQVQTNAQAVQTFGAPITDNAVVLDANGNQVSTRNTAMFAVEQPIIGTNVQKFNVYNLMQGLKLVLDKITPGNPNSIFTAEDSTLISQVPGLGGSLNFLDDFTGFINQYTDYRNINNAELQKILQKVNQVRSVCVTIQALDFKSILATAGNFLGVDIRAQLQKLAQFIDPARLLPTIEQIAKQVRGFVKQAQRVYNIIRQLQFLIKLAILLIKVFNFIQAFFLALPAPNMLTVHSVTATFEKARITADEKSKNLFKRLEQINGLLAVLLSFVRYLLSNAIELLTRLEILIAQLQACEYTKDSAVLLDLKASYDELKQIKEQLEAYVLIYDGKNSPDNALFGIYSIRVVDEELTDLTIQNKRRRGIALDPNGALITQSDLTFATNTAIIIEEVKVKLISLGLVASQYSTLNTSDLGVIATSVSYLEDDTVLSDDFSFANLNTNQIDPPDGSDENQGLGLNAFINNLKGGRKLRKRVRAAMENASSKFKEQVAKDKVEGQNVLNTNNIASSVGTGNEPVTGSVDQAQQNALKKQ